MAVLPGSLALTTIGDGALATAADLRNNFTAIQTENNSLLTILGGGTAGDVFTGVGTTVQFAKPSGYEYAYTEFTANHSVTNAEASATTVVTAAAVTFDGSTRVKIEFYAANAFTAAVSGAIVGVSLYDGATDIGRVAVIQTPAAVAMGGVLKGERYLTPSAAAHTYTARAWNTSGTGTIQAGPGGVTTYVPGFIRITKA